MMRIARRTKSPEARRALVMLLPVLPVAPRTATRGFWLAIVARCELTLQRSIASFYIVHVRVDLGVRVTPHVRVNASHRSSMWTRSQAV